jgi:hypothetical protein
MSRRLFQPTEQQRREVLVMAGSGIVQERIAKMLDIDPKTLRRAFRHELDIGMTEANVRVAKSLFEMATRDKIPSAAIFWLKARAGWREQQAVNIGGTDRPVGIDLTWAPARPPVPTKVSTVDSEAEGEDAEAGDAVVTRDGEKTE